MTGKSPKLWIALPCYGGTLTCATQKSLLHDIFPLVMRGVEVKIFDELGHADIYSLRAQIVANFLSDADADELVMIDTDVCWDAYGLEKLLSHDVDLVAAPYPKRENPIKFMFRSAVDDGGELMGDPQTGLVEVWGMPAGFMRMRRGMLEKMVDHYRAELGIYDPMVPGEECVRIFDPYFYTGSDGRRRALGEDYAFCQRWRDIGGKVWMDVSIPMAHIGTEAFKGELGGFIKGCPIPIGGHLQKEKAA